MFRIERVNALIKISIRKYSAPHIGPAVKRVKKETELRLNLILVSTSDVISSIELNQVTKFSRYETKSTELPRRAGGD